MKCRIREQYVNSIKKLFFENINKNNKHKFNPKKGRKKSLNLIKLEREKGVLEQIPIIFRGALGLLQ